MHGTEALKVGLHHAGSMLDVGAGGTEGKVVLCEVEAGLEGSGILAVMEGRAEVLECLAAWFVG